MKWSAAPDGGALGGPIRHAIGAASAYDSIHHTGD
jgi:hypothetical protein